MPDWIANMEPHWAWLSVGVLLAAAEIIAGGAGRARRCRGCGRGVDLVDRDDLESAASLAEIGDDRRARLQVLLIERADRGDVEEDIARTIGGRCETEPLFGVEPFDLGFDIFVRDEGLSGRRLATIEHGASRMSDRERAI